ncbi:hypothetical protein KUTeg_015332 [Tegillarca granosa]|uniref:Cytochrome P450 n=1 Tax=Tegillarca granosa TaxID=220873 RepID=A0ABQ9EPU5_TEGGR|nr:hypothetical protein KUTeg_015332 [Tegillarca granosa]
MEVTALFQILGILIATVVLLIAAILIWLHLERKKYDHVPGPPMESWLGNISGMIKMREEDKYFSEYILQNCQKYGGIFRMHFLHTTLIAVADPDAVKELLITGHYPKPKIYHKTFYSVAGQSYLKNMVPEINTCTDIFMSRLTDVSDGKSKIRMSTEFNHITLDVLCKIGFGMEINSVSQPDNPFTNAIIKTFEGASYFQTNPMEIWKYAREVRKVVQFLRNFGKKTIHEREEAVKRGDYIPDDILTLIMKYKEDDPDVDFEDLLDEFVTFFAAGQETTSQLLSFMMFTLGKNPESFKKLQAEIDDIIGNKSVISFEDIGKLKYLDMVIKETLRLYPPVPGTSRIITKDLTIGGYKFPAGTNFLISSYALHHNEKYFDNPSEFRPERFSDDAEERVNTYTYLPFVIGPRSCIGKHFAEIEAKIVMTKFMQRFEFKLDKNQSFGVVDAITVKPKDGAMCYLRVRA